LAGLSPVLERPKGEHSRTDDGTRADDQPTNDWEEQQKQDSLRKAYHKATCIPLDNVEAIWKAYDAFENNVNKQTVCFLFIALRVEADV
jgi:hypothetical protein